MRFVFVIIALVPAIAVSKVVVLNPYQDVNWSEWNRYITNLHAHTTVSDGKMDPDEVIDAYKEKGYRILAITDHDKYTWPWQRWSKDPSDLGMLAINGVEASSHDHLNGFFTDYAGEYSDIEASIQTIASKNGLSQISHPGRYRRSVSFYKNLYNKYESLVAMEVYNQRDRHPRDRKTWDKVLSVLMPDRPVWATANDDSHRAKHIGQSFQVMLMPGEPTEKSFRRSFTQGEFYACHDKSRNRSYLLEPDSVSVVNNHIIHVYPDSLGERVRWISHGKEVHRGPVIDLSKVDGLGTYVRAVLYGEKKARTLLQPFGLREE